MPTEKITFPKRKLRLSSTTIRVLCVGDPYAMCEGPTSKVETETQAPPCVTINTTYTAPTQAECKPADPPPSPPGRRPGEGAA